MGALRNPLPAKERALRILVADDHPIIRKKVRTVLESHPSFDVCAEVADGAEAVEHALRLKPDVVVLNITMPVLSGLEAAREIRVKLPESAIVILSSHADRVFIEEAKRVGAQAYVAKTKIGEALIKAIADAVASGDFVLVT
jgi:DNA-binding NarL/FixJ family response regulator